MAGESIASLLNKVWAAFRSAGITDDLRIIERTAALLLEQEGVQPGSGSDSDSDSPLPALSVPKEFNLDDVRRQLTDASQQAGGAGVLFDRSILFRLDTMLAGGRYPTPRHIVRLMTALAKTAGCTVADVACGSGGLLIHSQGSSLVGVDISPEWARIRELDVPLWSVGFTPNYATQGGLMPWGFNVPVACGRALTLPGDIIIADDDGAVVVPQQLASEVVRVARHHAELDDFSRMKLAQGG